MAEAEERQQKAIVLAEEVLWEALTQAVIRAGGKDSALYLRYWLSAAAEKVEPEGPYRRVRFHLYQRLSDYSARYNARTGEQMSWMFDALMEDLGEGLDEAACLEAARAVANPPDDAVLEVATYEEQADASVFVARWGHQHDGIPVERDYLQVLVNGRLGVPFAVRRKWHVVDETPLER